MYPRPILWTLYNALDFLKVLKIAVVGGGGGVLLVHSAYIMSLLMMAGIKYWDVMYTVRSAHKLRARRTVCKSVFFSTT
jgi:hypothetical protein